MRIHITVDAIKARNARAIKTAANVKNANAKTVTVRKNKVELTFLIPKRAATAALFFLFQRYELLLGKSSGHHPS